MANGMPDYHRVIRPKYGAGESDAGFKVAIANDSRELTTILGKGMIYGGYLRVEYTASIVGDALFLYVDEEKIGVIGFNSLNKWSLSVEHSYPFYIRTFDDVNFIYVVAFSHGFTFERSFRLDYVESNGRTPQPWWQIIYSLM